MSPGSVFGVFGLGFASWFGFLDGMRCSSRLQPRVLKRVISTRMGLLRTYVDFRFLFYIFWRMHNLPPLLI